MNCISTFFPHSAGERKLQWEETGKQSSKKAIQCIQQRSLKSVCSVNFRCDNLDRIKQDLTPCDLAYRHADTAYHESLQTTVTQSPLQPSSGHTEECFTTTEPFTDNHTHSIHATCAHANSLLTEVTTALEPQEL